MPPVACLYQNVDQTLVMKKYFQLFLEQTILSYFKENIKTSNQQSLIWGNAGRVNSY